MSLDTSKSIRQVTYNGVEIPLSGGGKVEVVDARGYPDSHSIVITIRGELKSTDVVRFVLVFYDLDENVIGTASINKAQALNQNLQILWEGMDSFSVLSISYNTVSDTTDIMFCLNRSEGIVADFSSLLYFNIEK